MNQTAKAAAQKIAKQIALEPLEILKTAKEQITGVENKENNSFKNNDQKPSQSEDPNLKLQNEVKSQRMLSALNQELSEIRRQNLFKELQQKIAQGEEVYLDDQNDLTIEQKQVLKAQQEAVKNQMKRAQANSSTGFQLFGSSKPSRRMGAGQKQNAQKQTTRVEKPVPPSG